MTHRIFSATVVGLLLPLGLWGQASTTPAANQPAAPYGGGEQPGLQYAGESLPQNRLLLGFDTEVAYDDNTLSTNNPRRREPTYGVGSRVGLLRQSRHVTLGLDYRPGVLLYQDSHQYNALNHSLALDTNFQFTPRFALRLRDSFDYRTGVFQPQFGQQIIPALGSPTSFNEAVYTPLSRERRNLVRVDATYQKSRRTSIALFGSYQQRDYLGQPAVSGGLFNSKVKSAGLTYLYRLSPHTTLGTLCLVQDMKFLGRFHSIISSIFPSFTLKLSPSVDLMIFAGPQYTRRSEDFIDVLRFGRGTVTITGHVFDTGWQGAAGGTLTKRSAKTVFEFSGQRTINDGGGLLTTVISSFVGLSVRRRLTGRWDAIWDVGAGQSKALSKQFEGGRFSSQTGGLAFERKLTEGLTARVGYNAIRQRTSGPVPFLRDFDRNRVSFTLFYQLKAIPLGR